MRTWVLATNVVVAGHLSPHGPPGGLLSEGNIRHYPPRTRGRVCVLTPTEAWHRWMDREAP